jgi:energy-coupling factor transporter ATP-binding protein EcfA2
MNRNDNSVLYLGRTNGRVPHRRFGMRHKDRFFHLLLIGRTGVGKTTLLETMVMQDIRAGRGLCLIDPHGDLYTRLLEQVPMERRADLIALDLSKQDQPYGYNPLRRVAPHLIPLAAGGMLSAMKKMWETEWGVRMEHVLRNALFALIEYGRGNLPDVLRLLTDDAFRKDVLRRVSNEQVRLFWQIEYPKYNPRYRQEAIAPIQNKIGAFLADPRMRQLFTQGKEGGKEELSLRRAMDDGKVLLVNLPLGKLGDDTAGLLGAFLVSTVALAAFSRADTPETDRPDFFLYVDEFQNFTTKAVVDMISGLRKFRLALTLGHQHLSQLTPDVRDAVLANVGSLVTFRVGPLDAGVLAREFDGVFEATDLLNLPNHNAYWKLMIDRAPARPFSGTTLRPIELPGE